MGKLFNKAVRFIIQKTQSTGLEQELNNFDPNAPLAVPELSALARSAAADGIVLLKNNNQVLPLQPNETVAVFGRCAIDYFTVGYGSGGDVISPYRISLMEGLRAQGVKVYERLAARYTTWCSTPKNIPDEGFWGHWPMSLPEMPLSEREVEEAAAASDVALVVIGRAAGESRENILQKGSYYLTNGEKRLLSQVCSHFPKVVVVMDCGNVIDMEWVNDFGDAIDSIVYAWQGGMESGHALTDVLTGKVNPSAKLTDTIALRYEDYPTSNHFGGRDYNEYVEDIYVGYRYFETFCPDRALFPFGFGLSYTTFSVQSSCTAEDHQLNITACVTNTGSCPGREVVQAYSCQSGGRQDHPAKVLIGFAKTKLLAPGETEQVQISVPFEALASYDDTGVTGHKNCVVLEAGSYRIEVGTDIRSTQPVLTLERSVTEVLCQKRETLAVRPEHRFRRMANRGSGLRYEEVPTASRDLKNDLLAALPDPLPLAVGPAFTFEDVLSGARSPEDFVAQLSPQELDELTHGTGPMNDPNGPNGNAGGFGGVTEALRSRGLPPMITTDGPSGIRLRKVCALLPCGTALACSFDPDMVERLYTSISKELRVHGSDMLLAPGMNIHRDPLCGRNFEYYSEDPLLTGKIAAGAIRGIQSHGASACPKHFACNNQETNRNRNDSRVSERALREIYLKGFEIAVKDAHPLSIMTSYNKINGVWDHYNYELVTDILRGEWGFDGVVITDWWMQEGASREFPNITNDAYRIRAQVDVLMPGDIKHRTLTASLADPEGVTLAEAQRCALNVVRFITELHRRREAMTQAAE